jgi:hypothetical protein
MSQKLAWHSVPLGLGTPSKRIVRSPPPSRSTRSLLAGIPDSRISPSIAWTFARSESATNIPSRLPTSTSGSPPSNEAPVMFTADIVPSRSSVR